MWERKKWKRMSKRAKLAYMIIYILQKDTPKNQMNYEP